MVFAFDNCFGDLVPLGTWAEDGDAVTSCWWCCVFFPCERSDRLTGERGWAGFESVVDEVALLGVGVEAPLEFDAG